ncbi:Pro-Pol polyprotein [Merluccius polli]|uniref:Pro-Pol polyprotein n=1 Tax=Merluccius polli TaxID=89951 RepID=A0AA47N3D8_MERPO|nr:Pro-Pol polyprotein [Merluccius polli]
MSSSGGQISSYSISRARQMFSRFPRVFTACAVARAMARAQTKKPSDVSKTGAAKVFVPELPAPLSSSEIIKAQKNDQSLEKYFALASGSDKADHGWSPHVDTDVADQVLQVVIPVEYRDLVLKTAHGDASGHFGHFYWPHIKRDVARYVKACHACQLAGKPNVSIRPAPLQSIQSLGTPFEHLIIDCVGPLPPSVWKCVSVHCDVPSHALPCGLCFKNDNNEISC